MNEVISHTQTVDSNCTNSEKSKLTNNASDMRFEEIRLNSFNTWPAHYPVNPSRLAKSGFFYTGHEDEVECFSCEGHISNWQFGDVVHKKHKDLFPHCKFIHNDSNNVPFLNDSLKTNTILQKLSINEKVPSSVHVSSANSCHNNHVCDVSELPSSENILLKSKSAIDFSKLATENERLKTFNNNWPLDFLSVQTLAKAGFFYLGYEDKVQCAFCHVIVSNWEESDIPIVEHSRHSPLCPFVIEYESNKNLSDTSSLHTKTPLVSESSCISSVYNEAEDLYKLIDKSQHHTRLEKLGVRMHKTPVHPQQATYQARLRSYNSWPDHFPVKKENLAAAGFFYIGLDDHTKCFNCDGGLCSWEVGDDPWIEHARWFRNCSFVLLNKGDDFINTCIKNHAKLEATKTHFVPSDDIVSTYYSSNDELFIKVNEHMNSSLIKAVIETKNFPTFLIREAVVKQLLEQGHIFSNVDEVYEAVHRLKETFCTNNNECDFNSEKHIEEKEDMLNLFECNNDKKDLSLKTSGEKSKTQSEDPRRICKVCFDQEAAVVFLPCGHLIACTLCALALNCCPWCREDIQATVRAYLPM